MGGNNIYVQGSYIDVHDNENVYLSVDKAEVTGVDLNDNESRTDKKVSPCVHDDEELFHFIYPSVQGDGQWLERQELTAKKTKLETDEAVKYWQRLQKAGFVDEHYQLAPTTTRKQAMYIAELFAEKLGIKSKWKTFEQLWGISNLAQEKWDMQETGSMPSRSIEIDKIFSD